MNDSGNRERRAWPARRRLFRAGAWALALFVASEAARAAAQARFSLPSTTFAVESPGSLESVEPGSLIFFDRATFAGAPTPPDHLELYFQTWNPWQFDGAWRTAAFTLPPPPREPVVGAGLKPWATGAVIAATVGMSLQNSLHEPSLQGFRFENEGFFGTHTYAGGADKAAHFVDYAITWRLLETTYGEIGYTGATKRWLAFGTSFAAGLATEIGDGTTIFGFSWQDLFMDALGAGIEMELARTGLNDTIGFRFGSQVSQTGTPTCCRTDDVGRDYSGEVYTADLKLSGLERRTRMNLGPARYLLFSVTYGSNGYRNAPPEWQQRLIGVELGIHFSEILRSIGVSDRTLLGEVLYLFFDSVRIPYTAIGVRYDLNHHEWHGPTTGRTTRSP